MGIRKWGYTGITFFVISWFSLTGIANAQDYNWYSVGPGGGSDLITITVHPEDPDFVLIGGDIEGMFKTKDGGDSWEFMNNNTAGTGYGNDVYWVQDLLFDPGDSENQTIYAGNIIGLFKSEDEGNSWERILPKQIEDEGDYISIACIGIPAEDSNTIFAGAGNIVIGEEFGLGELFRTTDGAENWEILDVPISGETAVYNIFIDSRSTGVNREIYIITDEGIFKSPDNGENWEKTTAGLPHEEGRELKGFIKDGQLHLYASLITTYESENAESFEGGIFYSSDDANSWTDITGDLPKYDVADDLFYDYRHFAINHSDPMTVYTAPSRGSGYENWGIYKTINGGDTWDLVDDPISDSWMNENFFNERYSHVMASSPSNSDVVYSGLNWIRKTEDGGQTWQMKNHSDINENGYKGNGLELMNVEDIAFDPDNENVIYVGYDDMGLFKSVDNGVHFRPLDLKQDPFEGYDAVKDIIINEESGEIYVSRNEGSQGAINSWFAAGQVWKSTDGGESFTMKSTGLPDGRPALISDPNDEQTLYTASFHNGIYKTENGAENWNEISNGLGAHATNIWSLAISNSNSQVLYAGSVTFGEEGAIFKTTDGGENWAQLENFPSLDVHTIAIDPEDENVVYAGGSDNWEWAWTGGLYKSTDGGNSWLLILDEKRIVDIEIDQNDPDITYVVSQSFYRYDPERKVGIHKSTDGGDTWEIISDGIQHKFLNFIKIGPDNTLYSGSSGGGLWKGTLELVNSTLTENPRQFQLLQNYPNPFNPTTNIEYILGKPENISIKVYDLLGREVIELINGFKSAGRHYITFDASSLPSGVYIYRLKTSSGLMATKKLTLIK